MNYIIRQIVSFKSGIIQYFCTYNTLTKNKPITLILFTANAEPIHPADPAILNTVNERLAPPNQPPEDEESPPQRNNVAPATMLQQQQQPKGVKSTAVQTIDRVLYRLRVFPTLKDIVDEENQPPDPKKRGSKILRYFRFLGRVAMCQFGEFLLREIL